MVKQRQHHSTVTNTPKISWRILGLVVGFQIVAAVLGVRLYLTQTNVFNNNPNWNVTKKQLAFQSYDGTNFSDYAPALAQNAVNLAAWNGFHEIITQKTFEWSKLEFRFQPSDRSYLYVIFDRSEDLFNALRISFTPVYRPALIQAKYTGEFLSQRALPSLPFTQAQWQTITLERAQANPDQYGLWINQIYITSFEAQTVASATATAIGFRGGSKRMLVDSVKIWDRDQKLVFQEAFDNQKNFWWLAIVAILIVVTINGLLYLALRSYPLARKNCLQLLLILSLGLGTVFALALLFQKPIRERYPDFNHWLYKLVTGQTNNTDMYLTKKTEWIFEEHPIEKPKDTKRLIVLGSSQIDGEGISRQGEDVAHQLQKIIDEKLGAAQKWEVIGTGVSGNTATYLLEAFQYQWLKYQPDLVVINLSSNDAYFAGGEVPEDFTQALETFVKLSQQYNFKLVFSTEANSVEVNPSLKTHAAMQAIAEKNQIPLLKTHDYLAKQTDRGILWWDYVHPTSFGYRLMSEYFYQGLEPLLKAL